MTARKPSTSTKPTLDIKSLLAVAKLPERSVPLALSEGDSYHFRLRALPARKFRALVAAQTEGSEVLDAVLRACLIDPVLDDEEWRRLTGDDEKEAARRTAGGEPVEDGVLTDGQYAELANVAWQLNRGPVTVPVSAAAR